MKELPNILREDKFPNNLEGANDNQEMSHQGKIARDSLLIYTHDSKNPSEEHEQKFSEMILEILELTNELGENPDAEKIESYNHDVYLLKELVDEYCGKIAPPSLSSQEANDLMDNLVLYDETTKNRKADIKTEKRNNLTRYGLENILLSYAKEPNLFSFSAAKKRIKAIQEGVFATLNHATGMEDGGEKRFIDEWNVALYFAASSILKNNNLSDEARISIQKLNDDHVLRQ